MKKLKLQNHDLLFDVYDDVFLQNGFRFLRLRFGRILREFEEKKFEKKSRRPFCGKHILKIICENDKYVCKGICEVFIILNMFPVF